MKAVDLFLKKHAVQGIKLDSRQISPGDLFVALKGASQDGTTFIQQAVNKGAVAVLLESEENFQVVDVPILKVSGLKQKMGRIAMTFFKTPMSEIDFIGITGTNGKTTCAHYISQLLSSKTSPCGFIGTLGFGFVDDLTLGQHTTPDPISLYQQISSLYQRNARTIVMEVSSHALSQARVDGIRFKTTVLTNITRDHLDYHGDLDSYKKAKEKLFTEYTQGQVVLNLDDPTGLALFKRFKIGSEIQVYGVSLKKPQQEQDLEKTMFLEKLKLAPQGVRGQLYAPFGNVELKAPIRGEYNVSNLLLALMVASLNNKPLTESIKRLNTLRPVPGRMTVFGGQQMPEVVIDYAHTPDALGSILRALRKDCLGELWCVFGCGGGRDNGKRALMAEIAELHCDHIILTQDNPRTEDPIRIIEDMKKGLKSLNTLKSVSIELNRAQAIELAIQNAHEKDVILVAGKGHEPYQIIGEQRIPYQDAHIVKRMLAQWKIAHA
jgi:UDP-N-acetylmuramoyl-L-alanyl-D-glutamate--2,6-diaminopimelate ligase